MQPLDGPQARGFASGSGAMPRTGSLLEVREYTLAPGGIKDYLKLTAEHAHLRRSLLPFLG